MTRFFCSQFFNSQGILSSCIIAWLMWFFHQIHPLNMNHLKGNHSLEMGRRMNKNSLKLTFLHLKIDVWKTTCSLSFLEAQKAYFQRAMAYLGATFQGGQKPHPVPLKTGGGVSVVSVVFPSLPPPQGFVRRHIRDGFATWEWMKSYIKRRDWKLVMCLRAGLT